jgi:hypothetical protein
MNRQYAKPKKKELDIDIEHLKKVWLINLYRDRRTIKSKELLDRYIEERIITLSLRSPQWGLKKGEKERSAEFAKTALRQLVDEGYIQMGLIDNEYVTVATQKLYDEDEYPIGFKRIQLDD